MLLVLYAYIHTFYNLCIPIYARVMFTVLQCDFYYLAIYYEYLFLSLYLHIYPHTWLYAYFGERVI
jgi:hypothetical protein